MTWFVMRRAKLITLLIAIAAAAPVAAVATWSIRRTLKQFSDPCATWGQTQFTATIRRDDPCRAATVHGQSKTNAAITAALVPGGLLIFAAMAVAGAALSRRRIVLVAAIGMLAETLVVFTMAPLTLIAGLTFLFLAKRKQSSS
jgi:hypothetical protein